MTRYNLHIYALAFDDDRLAAAKCSLCVQRIDRGLRPACTDNVCLAHCIDLVDTDAAVHVEEAR